MTDSKSDASGTVSQTHDSNALRADVAERPNMYTAEVAPMEAQMTAAARFQGAGGGFVPPAQGELLMPLLHGEQAAPRRLDGRQPAYVQQLAPDEVPYAMMFPAGDNDHGDSWLAASESPPLSALDVCQCNKCAAVRFDSEASFKRAHAAASSCSGDTLPRSPSECFVSHLP